MKKFLSLFMALALIITFVGPAQTVSASTIKISKSKVTLEIGSTLKLRITGTKNKVTWKSNNSSVASINKSGVVTAKKEGKTNVTAMVSNKKFTCLVSVAKNAGISTLSDVVSALKNKGLLSGEEIQMRADLIGAIKGISYSDLGVELYEFDKDSKAYKTLVKTKQVKLDGYNLIITVNALNGKFVLLCDSAENKDKIIKAFKGLKIK